MTTIVQPVVATRRWKKLLALHTADQVGHACPTCRSGVKYVEGRCPTAQILLEMR